MGQGDFGTHRGSATKQPITLGNSESLRYLYLKNENQSGTYFYVPDYTLPKYTPSKWLKYYPILKLFKVYKVKVAGK